MESDLRVIVKGDWPSTMKKLMSDCVLRVVSRLENAGEGLDLARMHRIVLAEDLAGELAELSDSRPGEPVTLTAEEYAIAAAKVVLLPTDEDYEIVPIFGPQHTGALLKTFAGGETGDDSEEDGVLASVDPFDFFLHGFHHELCHVHDHNKHIEAFGSRMVVYREGKDMLTRPLAEACWSEYIADLMSFSSVGTAWLGLMLQSFGDAILRTKPHLDGEILAYRSHGDVGRLVGEFERHAGFLIKSAAYVLGYLDGFRVSLGEMSGEVQESLSNSYFEPTWDAMHDALREMREAYPDGWSDPSVYDGLAEVIDNYYADMGMVLSTTSDGQAYARFPFRPETTP